MVEGVTLPMKTELRAGVLRARRAVPADVRDTEARGLCHWLPGLVRSGQTVCAYVPVGSEPGSHMLLETLTELGVRVLLPVARNDGDGRAMPMQWGPYEPGALVAAEFGLREPPPPWLPAGHIADAEVVLVPALAVDRRGNRLGRGAGFYDRSLIYAAPQARLVAVVRDEELVDELPADPHDVRMTHALTPSGGIVTLPR
ncbi:MULTISPECIES: 5-formyltetrahydrofolate cyclo-ligase [Mycolicibacterium]|uniref:5-formyltetrahydrofolate cyclo-ligase n=1 Tax=Mycolicibacterium TaxID=1866885 RepID=UPI000457F700|nr:MULTISPECIES: 5-formyltetrahydrofolate cyclo-ligase [Mycolicibacterium]MCV7338941.1 5-formyltetrahydrofolate cyclo-ligase [Mycolicibacterium senegalense]QZA23492.1 5-formyltetrahydrofolate cyclo-ligase [Mycolicibacterium senegalense]CDP89526.1 5,10-methenyltetrahydrofolate synthetase [Mycolicibacterium farcinogenes]